MLRIKYGVDVARLTIEEEKLAHQFILHEMQKEYLKLAPLVQQGIDQKVLLSTIYPWYDKAQADEMKQVEEAMKELNKYDFYASPL